MPHDDSSDSPEPDPQDRGRILVAAVLFEGALAPLALILGTLLGRDPLEGFAWAARDAAWGVVAALPMLALLGLGMRWPVGPLARVKRFVDEEIVPLLGGRPVSDLALISLAAGVGEEMLFRGVVQGVLGRAIGTWPALVAAATVFGLLHPITPFYVVIAGLLGAYLGAVWIGTGNLLTVIVAHALYDFVALLVLLPRPGADGTGTDGELRHR